MLLSVAPLSVVDTAIAPREHAVALAFVIFELASVLFAVLPLQLTKAMHLILEPLAFESLTVGPDVFSPPRDLVLVKRALVDASICKGQHPLPIFLAVLVATLVARPVGPRLNAVAMLLILEPVANVLGSIGMLVGALTVRLIVQPHSFVNVAIGVH